MVIIGNVDGTLKKIKPQKRNAFSGDEFSEKSSWGVRGQKANVCL